LIDLTEFGIRETPLVELTRLSPTGVRIFAKCEWHLPTGSVKDRVAAAMVAAAETRGLLRPGDRLIEPSSGNTGIALARIARMRGYRLAVVVPDNVSAERIELLEAFGAEVRFSPGAEGSNGAVRLAERLARDEGHLMLHQYENPANPEVHAATTGPEIVAQLAAMGIDRADVFVACLGTGGTLTGVGAHLKEVWPDLKVIAAEPPAGETIAGLRSLAEGYIPPVFDPAVVDRKLLVRLRPSIETTRLLLDAEGLFVGPSSGAAVYAALRIAGDLPAGSVLVTVLPDAGWKYLSTGIYTGPLDLAEEKAVGSTLW
jgi:cysteine synthase B